MFNIELQCPVSRTGLSESSTMSWVTQTNKGGITFSPAPPQASLQERSTKKADADGDPWGRTQKVHVLRASRVTGLERSTIQAGMSLMGQKMCPQCELGLLPLRPQTLIKYLFNLATWRRQGREWDRRDAVTLASINFSNLSDNIKASGFIFQRRLITILMPL